MASEFFAYVDAHRDQWIDRLAKAVAIESVSSDPARRGEVVKMMHSAKALIEGLGGSAELHPLGEQSPGLELPPIITGIIKAEDGDKKPTVLLYGHLVS